MHDLSWTTTRRPQRSSARPAQANHRPQVRIVVWVRPAPGEWDCLRLAAKTADRGNAGEELRPAFERRLKELGYGPRAIAHAFSTLTGPGTATEVLATLAHYQRLEGVRSVPVEFEIVDNTVPRGL
jgi:hypothetical protein